MNTAIFENYEAFLRREDQAQNGVSPEFVEKNPAWEQDNKTNESCWNCSNCSDCSDCRYCSNCSNCSHCNYCSDCSYCSEKTGDLVIPKIDGIHGKVLQAVSVCGALKMDQWHTCETTHCRAGWVVQLAGDAGKALEAKTSTEFAAMAIYAASSKISVGPNRFYDSEEIAMDDIKRCAAEEAAMLEVEK